MLKFLVDTNILITLEPVSTSLEPTAEAAAEFLALASDGHHSVVRHQAQRVDAERDLDEARRAARSVLYRKYPTLGPVRPMPSGLEALLGSAQPGTNNWVDNQLIGAVEANAVDFLVTEDEGIHRRARRASLGHRVLRVADARDMLQTFLDRPPEAPPEVRWLKATELQDRDQIFDSVRAEYEGLDEWFGKCRKESRDVCVIPDRVGGYAGVSIVARKDDKFGLRGKILKICQFKVDDRFRGRRYGELLLKTLFDYRRENRYEFAYLTAYEHHEALIRLFEDFGFQPWVERSDRGEVILIKSFRPSDEDRNTLDPLDFHRRFGPPALVPRVDSSYVVPIRPEFHRLLFPEAETQRALGLDHIDHPYGNALRKAYLSHSRIRLMPPGSTLFFYRSGDLQAITAAGVVEVANRFENADEIARQVGKRTVYSLDEIQRMAAKPVLAILFRQDRLLRRPIPLAEAVRRQLLSAPPQSIVGTREEGFAWLLEQIGA
jgi:GNAT superfamily N-acetyltransferase